MSKRMGLQPLPVLSKRQQVSPKMWSALEPQRKEFPCAGARVRVSEKPGLRSRGITKKKCLMWVNAVKLSLNQRVH